MSSNPGTAYWMDIFTFLKKTPPAGQLGITLFPTKIVIIIATLVLGTGRARALIVGIRGESTKPISFCREHSPYGGSITVPLTSCLTGLDSTKQVKLFQHKQIS